MLSMGSVFSLKARAATRHFLRNLLLLLAVVAGAGTPASGQSAARQEWRPSPEIRGFIHLGRPDKPAVLLFHGLGQSGTSAWISPSQSSLNFDYTSDPGDQFEGTHGLAAKGASDKVSISSLKDVDSQNWFDFLAGLGCTVATFTQPEGDFAAALPSARAAFQLFLSESAAINPSSPPPVALLGHGRGGLVIRQVLKELGTRGRVRWAITLHTPHEGTEMARHPERFSTKWIDSVAVGEELSSQKSALKQTFEAPMRALGAFVLTKPQGELAPGSALFTTLSDGEIALPGVIYLTYGGTKITYFKGYMWQYTADSAVEQNGSYPWTLQAAPFPKLSPVGDVLPHSGAEDTPGQGDYVVANSRAKLPWSTHFSNALNHVEALWDRGLQSHVAERLMAPLPAIPFTIQPSLFTMKAKQKRRFQVASPNPINVTWSVSGPGTMDTDGTYRAPDSIEKDEEVTIYAKSATSSATAVVHLAAKPEKAEQKDRGFVPPRPPVR
jgi:hypothetical protein